MILVKICGLSTPETVEAAIAHGAAWLGFVHFAKSPRHVTLDRLADLTAQVAKRVERVAVLVDPDDALADAIAPHVDVLQLHGSETPGRVAALKVRTDRAVWKAIPIASPLDFETAHAYGTVADRLLFDAKPPKDTGLPGGTGHSFDWSLMRHWTGSDNWLLAGGLTADNLARAVAQSGAGAVDLSSGLETAPGVKSAVKIRAVLQQAHSLPRQEESVIPHAG